MTVQHIHGLTLPIVDNYLLVDFSAEWCPPCKVMKPLIESLSNDTDLSVVVFGEVDVDAEQTLSEHFNVSSIPTFVLLANQNGQMVEVKKWIGAQQDIIAFKQQILQLTATVA